MKKYISLFEEFNGFPRYEDTLVDWKIVRNSEELRKMENLGFQMTVMEPIYVTKMKLTLFKNQLRDIKRDSIFYGKYGWDVVAQFFFFHDNEIKTSNGMYKHHKTHIRATNRDPFDTKSVLMGLKMVYTCMPGMLREIHSMGASLDTSQDPELQSIRVKLEMEDTLKNLWDT